MRKQAAKYESANSTCRDVGHDWQTTATTTYRLCQRHSCGAGQRLQDGVWITAVPERPRTDPAGASQQQHALPQQHTLFS